SLQLGGETDTLESGDEITFTESAVILERMIGQFIYGSTKSGEESPAGGGAGASPPAAGAGEER
ncbi:MAG: outer membrane lipid asymmetry maintenance protein MlaD, partial [Candidatus Binatia bacterium]